ncbi:hypothetical protein [Actinomadura gamaensis]|uniref:Uncharacterized protein n=1 Tax=Actinomadura gamaensis TaxID=1763541 RepID=A0ABV9TST8_9ACTN
MLASIIRTVVPVFIGVILAQSPGSASTCRAARSPTSFTVAVTTAYYFAGRLVEQHRPTIGRILLSLGLVSSSPVYVRE